MGSLRYLVYFCIFEGFILLCLVLVFAILARVPDALAAGGLFSVALSVVKMGLAAAFVLGGSWIAHDAARRCAFEDEDPQEAFGSAVSEIRMSILLLPVVAKLRRQRPSKPTCADPQEESRFEKPTS